CSGRWTPVPCPPSLVPQYREQRPRHLRRIELLEQGSEYGQLAVGVPRFEQLCDPGAHGLGAALRAVRRGRQSRRRERCGNRTQVGELGRVEENDWLAPLRQSGELLPGRQPQTE